MINEKQKNLAADILADILGGILIAVGTYNFASAANFPMVGVNGIALIFYHAFGAPIGLVAVIINIPIILFCYRILGKNFFLNSLRSIAITSFIMDYLAPMFPVYHGDTMLAALCTGITAGLGYAFIYMRGSSTGGSDFIVMALKAKNPHIALGKFTFGIDIAVVLAGTILISRDVDGLIYGIIVSFLISMMVDKVMYGIDSGKVTLVVTSKPEEVAEKICEISDRGATFLKAEGSFLRDDKKVVMCACNNKQMYPIRIAIKEIDPEAFIIIMESNEVVGEGFKEK